MADCPTTRQPPPLLFLSIKYAHILRNIFSRNANYEKKIFDIARRNDLFQIKRQLVTKDVELKSKSKRNRGISLPERIILPAITCITLIGNKSRKIFGKITIFLLTEKRKICVRVRVCNLSPIIPEKKTI